MSKANTFETEHLTDPSYYILLSLLNPRHGYAIMKYVEELTQGEVIIGPSTLYTLLKKMTQGGFIKHIGEESDRKKQYIVTRKGFLLVENEVMRRVTMARHGVDVLNEEAQNYYEE